MEAQKSGGMEALLAQQGDLVPLRTAGALSDAEIRALFYRPLDELRGKAALDGLVIRRDELRKAMIVLKEARTVSGKHD